MKRASAATLSRRTSLIGFAIALICARPLDAQAPGASAIDLDASFTLRVQVRMTDLRGDLPMLVGNKDWEGGAVRDYTTNNAYGLGRESGKAKGFAISVLPDGAWTWNAGDGAQRVDHRPEARDQGIADGRWHEVGFSIDREQGVAHLYHDGRRVALHDLQGVDGLATSMAPKVGAHRGVELKGLVVEAGVLERDAVAEDFVRRLGAERRPAVPEVWDGQRPLRVLAWNIWHGGRRKGRDEGVQRVVDVIRASEADVVLMQETYGSGPRIAGRLGFDYFLRSSNLSVMSRFAIRDVHRLYQGFRFGGVTVELRPGVEIQAYSLWIHYLPSVQKQLAADANATQLAAAEMETRGAEIRDILKQLMPRVEAAGLPVLVGGDFNSGSHLDWTEAAAELQNHAGRVVRWPVSLSMAEAGFVDSYRAAHPNPVTHPGHTWSPEFRESHQDRIDYVYSLGDRWRVVDATILNEHPRGWPSDHAASLAVLKLLPAEGK